MARYQLCIIISIFLFFLITLSTKFLKVLQIVEGEILDSTTSVVSHMKQQAKLPRNKMELKCWMVPEIR